MTADMTESRFRLSDISHQIGNSLMRLVYVPHEADVHVQHVAILESGDEPPLISETLALFVGASDAESVELALQDVAHTTVVAIAVREFEEDLERAVATARRCDVALVFVPRSVSWERLYSLLRTSVHHRPLRPAPDRDGSAGDLFALANALASTLSCPVTVDDRDFQTLAYSDLSDSDALRRESVLARKPPEDWISRITALGVMNHIRRPGETVRVPAFSDIVPASAHPRVGIAVQAGSELLGYIWVEEAVPVDEEGILALQESARIAALYMLRDDVIAELVDADRQSATEALLAGDAKAAAALDIPDGWRIVVIAVGARRDGAIHQSLLHRTHVAFCWLDRVLFVVLAEPPNVVDPETIKRYAGSLVSQSASRDSITIRAGSSEYGFPAAAPMLVRQARQALHVLIRGDDGREVATISEVRSEAVSYEIAALVKDSPAFNIGPLGDFLRSASQRDRDRALALSSYLEHLGNATVAAQSLNLPINTFRYRLTAALDAVGLDLSNPTERLIAELQLLAWSLEPHDTQ